MRPITFEELSSKATDIENYMQRLPPVEIIEQAAREKWLA
jgi:hypothetical protein